MNLYVVAKEDGRRKLFKVSYLLSSVSVLPKPVASECSNFGIQGYYFLSFEDHHFVTHCLT